MSEGRKVPYVPSQFQRYEVSPDPYSQERYRGANAALKAAKEQLPCLAGAVLLGSLSKGKLLTAQILSATDLDLVYFVDADESFLDHPRMLEQNPQYKETAQILQAIYPLCTPEEIALITSANHVMDITAPIINTNLSEENRIDLRKSTVDVKPIAITGENSIYDQCVSNFWGETDWVYHTEPLTEARQPSSISNVALFWGWDLDGGLQKYRKAFFDTIEGMGIESRDINWKVIANYVEYWERKYQIPLNLRRFYPQTFEEAKSYYLSEPNSY
jgi:hypothetical protein